MHKKSNFLQSHVGNWEELWRCYFTALIFRDYILLLSSFSVSSPRTLSHDSVEKVLATRSWSSFSLPSRMQIFYQGHVAKWEELWRCSFTALTVRVYIWSVWSFSVRSSRTFSHDLDKISKIPWHVRAYTPCTGGWKFKKSLFFKIS